MGSGERRHPRRPFARRLVGRSLDLRRAARQRHPVRGHAFTPLWRKTGWRSRGERIRHRARQFRRTSTRDDSARPRLCSRRSRRLGLRASQSAFPGGAHGLSGGGRLGRAGHGLPLEASLQAFILAQVAAAVSAVVRLGPIGQTTARRSRRRLFLACGRWRGGVELQPDRSWLLRVPLRNRRHASRDAIFEIVPS